MVWHCRRLPNGNARFYVKIEIGLASTSNLIAQNDTKPYGSSGLDKITKSDK